MPFPIALGILGVIAAFAIPKVLQAQQASTYKAMAKEAAGMLSAAYSAYRVQNVPSVSTSALSLTPYINYIAVDTTSDIDSVQYSTTRSCPGWGACLLLHNGARILMADDTFANTSSTSIIHAYFDPDGKVTDGTTTGPGKSIEFFIFYDGRITTWGTAGTFCNSWGSCPGTQSPSADPPWFSWN